ncbi:MAG: DUF2231 domain-containing protein [Gemmatimonas sp.]
MAEERSTGVRSTVAIGGHPIHPMLVPFPIAFLVGALATDLTYTALSDPFWARASLWLVAAGLTTGAAAAVVGLIEFSTIKRARGPTGKAHFIGNAVVLVLAAISLLLRIRNAETAVIPVGLVLSFLTSGVLLMTGWLGGELAYRLKIGVGE